MTYLIKRLHALGIPDWATARHMMAEAVTAIEALQAQVTNEHINCAMADESVRILQARVTELETACNKFSEAEMLCRPVPAKTLSDADIKAILAPYQGVAEEDMDYDQFVRSVETYIKGGTMNHITLPRETVQTIFEALEVHPDWRKESHCEAIEALRAALAQPKLMIDMTPPATSRDRWMYEQGRLAERDPRSHVAKPEPVVTDQVDFEKAYGGIYAEQRKQLAESLAQPEPVDAMVVGCVMKLPDPAEYQYRWTNPSGGDQPKSRLSWEKVEKSIDETISAACEDLASYRVDGKPCYEIRKLYTEAQLKQAVSDALEAAAKHEYVIDLPDGDTRETKVWWSEQKATGEGLSHRLSITVSETPSTVVINADYREMWAQQVKINQQLAAALARPEPATAKPNMEDAYVGAREDVAIWKKRALEAEALNRKFIAEVNGPTFMGEPAQPEPVACSPICELCVKRGYSECANVAKTTPLPALAQPEPVEPERFCYVMGSEAAGAALDSAERCEDRKYDPASFDRGYSQGRYDEKMAQGPDPYPDERPGQVSWNLKYADSTPNLSVGHSAFEDWFQQQPFATQVGIKQMCRDSYAAGMGDPLVTYAQPKSIGPRPTYGAVGTRDVDVAAAMERWDAQAAALAQPEPMVDMTPPATSRDRWMYEQGRLAERDPRSHVAQPEPDACGNTPYDEGPFTIAQPEPVVTDQVNFEEAYGGIYAEQRKQLAAAKGGAV